MSVKPILFSTEMVCAILDGRKAVTRRVAKPQPMFGSTIYPNIDVAGKVCAEIWGNGAVKYIKQPYHRGDILWVRETWNRGYIDSSDAELSSESWFEEYHKRDGSYLDGISGYVYRADFTRAEEYDLGTLDEDNTPSPMSWRPSIHMPREAARIFLRVTDVRVQRLQEIDEDGAIAEGCSAGRFETTGGPWGVEDNPDEWAAREDFSHVWDSTIKHADLDRYGWAANPWVWVIHFERCEKPEGGNHGNG